MSIPPADLPLPHGPRARFLHAILDQTDHTVTAVASLHHFQSELQLAPTLDLSEWALEILAQATPLLLTHTTQTGVIAKVDHLTIHRPLLGSTDLHYLHLKRLSPPDSPLPHFHGVVSANRDFSSLGIETDFKVALTPLPPP